MLEPRLVEKDKQAGSGQDPAQADVCQIEQQKESINDHEKEFYSSIRGSRLRQFQLLLGLATITSPLTATIYFPLLPLLRQHFETSAQATNLTLTVYVIFQGISPVIFGPLSDLHGRRLLFLATLLLYVVGNVGLSLNRRSYAGLLVLRAIQSLGASAAYAISFGVVADVCPPSERGRMLGPVSMALNLGACVGPVAGGAVAYKSQSYEWAFYVLVIIGAILLVAVGLFLPETARSIVGDGSDHSQFTWWQLSWMQLLLRGVDEDKNTERGSKDKLPEETKNKTPRQKYTIGIFLSCLRIIFHRDTFLTLWMHGSFYVVDYAFVAVLPDIFAGYGFNELYIGLSYLPRGTGIIIGSYFTGKLMDRNYRVVSKEVGWESTGSTSKASGDDLLRFPIERARTRCSCRMLVVSTATMIGYGWAAHYHAHFAVLLVLQFLQGFWGTFFYTTYSALLVDSFPQSPSTAAASTSVTRTLMAAAGIAVLQPLLDAAGKGWYFTVLGLWSGGLGYVAVLVLRRKGMAWRRERNGLDAQEANIDDNISS